MAKKRILLIEDVDDASKVITARLKHAGYKVICAKDGQEGLEKIDKEKPDLVITDLAMPNMTGSILVRHLRASFEHKTLPIIMLSAFVKKGMQDHVEVPADAYILKTDMDTELIPAVKKLLGE